MARALRSGVLPVCLAAGLIVGCPGAGDGTSTSGATEAASSSGSTAASTGATTAVDPTTGSTTAVDPTTGPGTGSSTSSGSTTGDTGTSSGSTGDTGVVGSAGCGILAPPGGPLTIDVQGQMGQYIVSLPAGYDPTTPYPLGFAFHGRNRTGPNCQEGDCAGFQAAMENDVILIYMTSLGGTGWEGDGEREINVEFFNNVLDTMVAGYCVDESRVFAAGTSSGAHFVNILGCRFGDRLLAVAPVAGVLPEKDNCVDSVAALVIHGIADVHVPFSAGEEARDFWRDRNGCGAQTVPPIADIHAAVEAEPESHACATYQGCGAGLSVVWCEHSEGGYDGTTHGWPLFGGQQIWEFIQGL